MPASLTILYPLHPDRWTEYKALRLEKELNMNGQFYDSVLMELFI
ncbi:MAG TPA: hypothetical protein VD999_00950 [Vitreimonas sp.]|nr:hypothetical protein [Vitreimonas sp.]